MQKRNGFTLIELMITVTIIGILASIAVPTYLEHTRKSRRTDAEGALVGFANAMERHYTLTNSYCDAAGASGSNSCGAAGTNDTGSPTIFPSQTPVDGGNKYYNLTISAVSVSGFTLSATPISGTDQADDKCGTLTLSNTGLRGDSLGDSATCWNN